MRRGPREKVRGPGLQGGTGKTGVMQGDGSRDRLCRVRMTVDETEKEKGRRDRGEWVREAGGAGGPKAFPEEMPGEDVSKNGDMAFPVWRETVVREGMDGGSRKRVADAGEEVRAGGVGWPGRIDA